MEKFVSKKGVSVYAYKGDAMTLLAFDLDKSLKENFAGFTIKGNANGRPFNVYNQMKFKKEIKLHKKPDYPNQLLASEFSPIQKFRWIHVPSTIEHVANIYYGDYTYEVTPRYIENGKLLAPDPESTVSVTIDVSPFKDGDIQVGFTRSFISSQAFAMRFGNKLNLRPNAADLTFDIEQEAGIAKRLNYTTGKKEDVSFSYKEIHEYLGWQTRQRIVDFLNEVIEDNSVSVDVFAYDLNEPFIVEQILQLAKEGRARVILDNYPDHKKAGSYENKFEDAFKAVATGNSDIYRGHFTSQAHSKIFIQRKNNSTAKAIKVLTGSTNFATNGLYVNANHVIIFNKPATAQKYADVFDGSFGDQNMGSFKNSALAATDYVVNESGLPDMTIRFSPHKAKTVDTFFKGISEKILNAESDVLFAVMKDDSKSGILDALKEQVKASEIFTAGITDVREGMQLYKPGRKTGIRISGLNIATKLRPPFKDIIKVPGLGHSVHHKFVVVDFKGSDPAVYCGSSNLAYTPEQNNGDNLIEIRDKDVVTAFAIEAFRLIDHFHWLNKLVDEDATEEEMHLYDNTEKIKWYAKYYNPKDLKFMERMLFMK